MDDFPVLFRPVISVTRPSPDMVEVLYPSKPL